MSAAEEALIVTATAMIRDGKATAAQPLLLRALQKNPLHPQLNALAAQASAQLGQKDQAMYYIGRACKAAERQPPSTQAACLWTAGAVFEACGSAPEAVDAYERAVALEPRSLQARQRIVQKLGALGWFTRAARHAREAVALAPQSINTFNMLMNTLMASGDVRASREAAEGLLAHQPHYLHAAIAAAFARNYFDVSREEAFTAHQRVGALFSTDASSSPPHARDNARHPLRLGILSADFKEHSVSYFLEPILRHIDRSRFRIYCYSADDRTDHRTCEFEKMADVWRPAAALDPAALAATIRADEIDILLETSGLTRGNRLEALALKPAPVQMTYCGYPNTTGHAAMDYRIVDSITDPPGAEAYHTEKLLRPSPCFLCYAPPASAPEVSPSPFEAARAVTFGSFGTLLKVTDRVLETWGKIVASVPNARLLLKGQQLADPEMIERLLSRLESAGLDRSRVTLLDFTRTPVEHLALYSKVDIALDPFPYNGTTTICEAAWMGVPTITFAGDRHAGRVGASLLTAIGLPEFIASDLDSYRAKAVSLANDAPRLRELRATLRDRTRQSTLCDGPGFTRRFETALQEMRPK